MTLSNNRTYAYESLDSVLSEDDLYIKERLEEIYHSFDERKKTAQIEALMNNESFMRKARRRMLHEESKMTVSMRRSLFNLLEGAFLNESKGKTVEIDAVFSKEEIETINYLLNKTMEEIIEETGIKKNGHTVRAQIFQVNPAVHILCEIILSFHEDRKPSMAISLFMFYERDHMKLPLAAKYFENIKEIKGIFQIKSKTGITYLVHIMEEKSDSVIETPEKSFMLFS